MSDHSQPPAAALVNVTKHFGDHIAVDDVSLDIRNAEILSLLGGSGSGKTTILRILAPLESVTSGRVLLNGTDAPAYRRTSAASA